MQWPTSDSEFEYVPVSEAEVCCSTGVLMDLDDGRKRECACVRTCTPGIPCIIGTNQDSNTIPVNFELMGNFFGAHEESCL